MHTVRHGTGGGYVFSRSVDESMSLWSPQVKGHFGCDGKQYQGENMF